MKTSKVLRQPIDILDLSPASISLLRKGQAYSPNYERTKIDTINDLVTCPDRALLHIRGMARKRIDRIDRALSQLRLQRQRENGDKSGGQ